jgi:hypothetical protein
MPCSPSSTKTWATASTRGARAMTFATYGETITKAIAGVVSANGTAEDPRSYGGKVAHRFLPNLLPYEVGTPAVFGFVEWNGRSLTDNAPDVMFYIASNTPVHLGIGKESVTPSRRGASLTLLPSSERAVRPHESSHASHVPRPTFLWLGGARPSCDTPSRTR